MFILFWYGTVWLVTFFLHAIPNVDWIKWSSHQVYIFLYSILWTVNQYYMTAGMTCHTLIPNNLIKSSYFFILNSLEWSIYVHFILIWHCTQKRNVTCRTLVPNVYWIKWSSHQVSSKTQDTCDTGMMGARTMTADRIVPRPGAKFNAVRLSASNATWQMPAVGSHVPETLAPITLKHTVPRLKVGRLKKVVGYPRPCLQRSTGISVSSAPPTFRDGAKPSRTKEVQSLTQQQLVMPGV